MNNKGYVYILLVVLLVSSLVVNFLLYKQFTSSKGYLAEHESRLGETIIKMEDGKHSLTALSLKYEGIQRENNRLLALAEETDEETEFTGVDENGYKEGEGVTDVPSGMIPANPNKILPTGNTLGQFKIDLDNLRKMMISNGSTEEEADETLDAIAKEEGTSLAEVNRIQDDQMPNQGQEPIEPVKPVETSKPTKPNEPTTKPSNPDGNEQGGETGTPSNTGGSTIPPEFDKNGNGIHDKMEESNGDGDNFDEYDGRDSGGGLHTP